MSKAAKISGINYMLEELDIMDKPAEFYIIKNLINALDKQDKRILELKRAVIDLAESARRGGVCTKFEAMQYIELANR